MTTTATTTVVIAIERAVAETIVAISNLIKNSPTGVSFLSVKNYKNSKGEIANHLVNIGQSYESTGKKDLAILKDLDVTKLANDEFDVLTLEKAKQGLIKSIVSPNERMSNGQKDAYTIIDGVHGIKIHKASGDIFIQAQAVSKTVLVKGEYKPTNKQKLTLAKEYLSKELNLSRAKFRYLKLNCVGNLTIKGTEHETIGDTVCITL